MNTPKLIEGPNRTPAWRVEWQVDGKRGSRRFKTEEEAYAFLPSIPKTTRRPQTDAERIKARVDIDAAGCWIWKLQPHPDGYGLGKKRGKTFLAHRLSYETFVGPIPEGLEIDHLCRVRACVNPDHLEPVTSRENSARSPINFVGVNLRKTHCPQGHPYDEANTRITYKGGRECKECRRATGRRWRERQALRAANAPTTAYEAVA